ncbi:hypothetical protein [Enterococcus sp. A8]|uniref:hypothetical protein n=1 Tax=Enterobacter sp. A8 TaxID=2507249 RepID=UPI00102ED785|nr:hypothetical protein [Enterobacter sp. A8]
MTITEDVLLRSGFTKQELQQLKCHAATQHITLELLLPALSNRFKGILILSVMLIVMFIQAVCFASPENIISLGVAVVFIIGIFCWMTPLKLAYKAWRLKT